MDKSQQIRDRIREMGGEHAPMPTLLAQVTGVDENALTCDVIADGLEIYDVRLCPVLNGKQNVIIVPKVGSWALCARVENEDDWMLLAVDDANKVRITNGTMIFEMSDGKYLVKSGNDDLQKIMNDTMDAIIAMKFTTNTGVTINLVNAAQFDALKTRFNQLLKTV